MRLLSAGRLRFTVQFQRRATTQDTFGQQSTAWVNAFTANAEVKPLSGRELEAAQQVTAEVSHKVTIRYRDEFANPASAAAMRVVFRGRYFNIQAPLNEDERNVFITLLTVEGLNNG